MPDTETKKHIDTWAETEDLRQNILRLATFLEPLYPFLKTGVM